MENAVVSPTPVPDPAPLRLVAQRVLHRIAESAPVSETVHVHAVFDQDNDHYLVVAEGWQGYRRVYRIFGHVALIDDCLHVYEDGTIEGIADRLQAEGIPKEKIVCEWTAVPIKSLEGA